MASDSIFCGPDRGSEWRGGALRSTLWRMPCQLLGVGKREIETLLREGHRVARNYTPPEGDAVYRCPVSGCSGATINAACAVRAILPHFHRDLLIQGRVFNIRIESRRGWYHARIPEEEKEQT